jgi:hypothetical protein
LEDRPGAGPRLGAGAGAAARWSGAGTVVRSVTDKERDPEGSTLWGRRSFWSRFGEVNQDAMGWLEPNRGRGGGPVGDCPSGGGEQRLPPGPWWAASWSEQPDAPTFNRRVDADRRTRIERRSAASATRATTRAISADAPPASAPYGPHVRSHRVSTNSRHTALGPHRRWRTGADREDRSTPLWVPGPGQPVGQATKYLAWGWWQMMAVVDCSGWSWKPSLTSTPMRSAPSSSTTLALSSSRGQAG